ncbi:Transposase family tnp2 [Rhizoctonia solani]|uniref:Transposase family tnp2 n=1 Tax=Rhizoctonia solani TaxID=456999 RepID=A0A8H8P2H4_9AGAM|nr:Transposase family tnp2 [Rhizoctonia solani]QRW23960.1 Transposase family tnp2 [Rhizoctonia solani]
MANNIDMGGPSTSNPTHPDNPLLEYPCSEPASQPQFGSDSYLQSRPLSPSRTNSGLGPHSAFPLELISWPRPTSRPMSWLRSRSSTRSCLGLLGPCLSELPRARSKIVSFNRESITADSSSNNSDSDYPDYSPEYFVLKPTNPENDAELFGKGLAGFRIATPPAFYLGEDKEDEENEEEEEDPEGPQDPNGDPDAENKDGPPIQVDPEGEPGPPEEPGTMATHKGCPRLTSILSYAIFICAILESHKSLLLALADLQGGAFPADFAVQPIEENVPPPIDPEEWFHEMGPDDKFGNISQASGWRNQEVGLRQRWDGVLQEYIDEPTGKAPLSLVCLPYGISLGLNSDGYQAHGKFAAGGNYSVTGVYIIVNNLPFYLQHMIKNIILVIVMPGPKEPKGYALSQMLEPLVNDLIELMNGMDLPVYNLVTGQTEQRRLVSSVSGMLELPPSTITARTAKCDSVSLVKHEDTALQSMNYKILMSTCKLSTSGSANPILFAARKYGSKQARLSPFSTKSLGSTLYKLGMLRKRYRQQPSSEIPEARFDAFMRCCYFPHFCGRLPTKLSRIGGHTKAEQWNTLLVVLPAALFEAWRVGNSIPENEIPRGGQNTRHFKQQQANARRLLRRRRHVHDMDQGELDNVPELGDCFPSRNPRDYFANILRYCVAHAVVTQHWLSRQQIDTFTPLFKLIATTFAKMNINLPPIFHAATHLRPFLLKYGSVYGTRVLAFERVNRMLINVNTNGHGQGVLEATMAKGFLRRAECYRYAMRNGPEHEIQREMLDAVLAGQAPFRGQEHIRLATVSAKISFHNDAHSSYYPHMIEFCNNHYPFNNARFYGPGVRPPNGIYISPTNSTVMYSHFHRYSVRYGSAHHSRGYNSRFGFIYDRKPVIIKGIYATTVAVGDQDFTFVGAMVRRFILPVQQPVFPWDHWDELLQIQAWEYRQFAPVEPVPLSAFTGVFAMSNIQMLYGRYTLTFAMIKTHPEDLVEGYNNHDQGVRTKMREITTSLIIWMRTSL